MKLTSTKGFSFRGLANALKNIEVEELENGLFRITSENPKFKAITNKTVIADFEKQIAEEKIEAEKQAALNDLTDADIKEILLKKKTVKELQAILVEKGKNFDAKANKETLIALVSEALTNA